jgi:4'-phosphopantetheinyl transferase
MPPAVGCGNAASRSVTAMSAGHAWPRPSQSCPGTPGLHAAPQHRTGAERSRKLCLPCEPAHRMSRPLDTLEIGPVRCAWMPHARGTPTAPLVHPWLATQLGVDEAELGLWRDGHGRPHLGAAHAGFDVNWSHSGERLLVALGTGVRTGADLEFLRPRPRAMVLAERFFAPGETAALQAMPADTREAAFVRLWCAKEAVLKAHGRGIAFGLHRLEFACVGDRWHMRACDPALGAPEEWTLHAFVPMPGYLATLAWRST